MTYESPLPTSLVVITYNRCADALRTVAAALALPELPEVIVVDNGSTDGTAESLRAALPAARVVRSAVHLGASGRNLGVRVSEAPVVALCDGDTVWTPGSVARAASVLHRHPDVAVVCGTVVVGPGGEEDPTSAAMRHTVIPATPALPYPGLVGFLPGASMVRRDAFLAVGGFEPRPSLGCEERLLSIDLLAAGWRLVHDPGVVVRRHPVPVRPSADHGAADLRDEVLVSWLRMPLDDALGASAALARRACRDRVARRAVRALARHWWFVVRRRRPVPGWLARTLRAQAEMDRRLGVPTGI